jgi:hypothetical protein
MERKIDMGEVLIHVGALSLDAADIQNALSRFEKGDWGDTTEEDKMYKEAAIRNCDRVEAVYHDSNGTEFWIVREPDWEITVVIMPEDYFFDQFTLKLECTDENYFRR